MTSLEEFRLESEEMTEQLNQLKVSLKEKEQQLPLQLERMERQMLLEIQKYVRYCNLQNVRCNGVVSFSSESRIIKRMK